MIPLINGQAYAWGVIKLNVLGAVIAGVTGINYKDDQDMEDNMGAGNYPVSRGYGAVKATADLTLHMEEVESLQAVAPSGRLQEIPEFDIPVSYIPKNGKIVTHILKNCRFKNNSREAKQGDMKLECKLELQVSHIVWNG